MKLIDSHCHIDGERYDEDRVEVIERARRAGVAAMLNVGTGSPSRSSFENTVRLAEENDDIFAAVGVHPHDASEYDEDVERRLCGLASSSDRIIAWGEIGLDYHYDHSPRDNQRAVFRRQLRVARDCRLPVVIHSRSADEDTLDILRSECSDGSFPGGIMHCFGGSPEMAAELAGSGFLISFAGNVTFKNAEEIRDAARAVPADRMLVETDCPYLTPVPYRGKRNEPARVVETALFLADLLGIGAETFARQTNANFCRFFGIDIDSASDAV